MSTSPAPSASRGDITLQPSYFTSSLYVGPLREDISRLIYAFSEQYVGPQQPCQPFALFKKLWTDLGWSWIHFKVFDARARETFIDVTERLFLERMADTEPPLARVIALFALYTFYSTQPSTSTPALRCSKYLDVPIDAYTSIIALPSTLIEPGLHPLQPYVIHLLTTLIDSQAFHILPRSELRPFNPSVLPREIFVQDGEEPTALTGLTSDETASSFARPQKKKGRPSRREKAKKAKDALVALEKYVEKNSVPSSGSGLLQSGMQSAWSTPVPSQVTHTLLTHPPTTTRNNYRAHKMQLLDVLDPYTGAPSSSTGAVEGTATWKALEKANEALLARLREIDALAAEKGLEVGGEGGEKTGLARVEKAAKELHERSGASPWARGGILGLLEGAGLDFSEEGDVGGSGEMDGTGG
ncbi:hypothetical protein BKA93DRAFT_722627 [Sparassis latifolia]